MSSPEVSRGLPSSITWLKCGSGRFSKGTSSGQAADRRKAGRDRSGCLLAACVGAQVFQTQRVFMGLMLLSHLSLSPPPLLFLNIREGAVRSLGGWRG